MYYLSSKILTGLPRVKATFQAYVHWLFAGMMAGAMLVMILMARNYEYQNYTIMDDRISQESSDKRR